MPEDAVDRAACRSWEEQFIGRFLRRLKEIKLLHNPMTNRAVDLEDGTLQESSDEVEVKALVRRHLAPDQQAAAYETMPRNRVVTIEYSRRRMFGGRKPLAAAAAATVNPMEELAREGEGRRPAGPAELASIVQKVAVKPGVFYYILAFSPTGWDPGARSQGLSANAVVALASPFGGGIRVYIPEGTGAISRKAFDLTSYAEKFRMLEGLIDRCGVELVLGDFTEDLVADRLHFERGIIENLFEDAAAQDPFLLLDNRRSPIRLLREYSRAVFPGPRQVPEENELIAVRDAASRDNARIQCMLRDLDVLFRREEELLERGARAPERERRLLAHLLRRLRQKQQELSARLSVIQKRSKILTGYLLTLEQLRTARTEQIPDAERLESMMARAGVARDQLKELADLAEAGQPQPDPETEDQIADILMELETGREAPAPEPEQNKTASPETPRREPEKRDRDEDEGMLLES